VEWWIWVGGNFVMARRKKINKKDWASKVTN
jgi:hypothetical protein